MDMGDPETRLLTVGTVGWFLAGILTAILFKTKRKERQLAKAKKNDERCID